MLLRTPDASEFLQVSESYLKRKRDTHGGFLVAGEHYFLGESSNTSIRWDVDAIQKLLHKRGQLRQMNSATTAQQGRKLAGVQ